MIKTKNNGSKKYFSHFIKKVFIANTVKLKILPNKHVSLIFEFLIIN